MNKLFMAFPAAILLAAPATGGEQIQLSEKEQANFDKRLAGRTAGKPVSCIPRHSQRNMNVISDDILIFSSSRNAKTIYVNKPYGGCRDADRNVLVFNKPSSSLCRGEIVQVVDKSFGGTIDSCAFGKFVPYTKLAAKTD